MLWYLLGAVGIIIICLSFYYGFRTPKIQTDYQVGGSGGTPLPPEDGGNNPPQNQT